MKQELLEILEVVREEEREILEEGAGIRKERYTEEDSFVVSARKMMGNDRKLIQIRTHTRFIDFPKHRHDFIEMMYVCKGSCTHIIDGQEITVQAGEFLLLNQYSWHEIKKAEKDDISVNFVIRPEFFDKPYTMLGFNNVITDFLINVLRKNSSQGEFLYFQVADILPVQNLIENMVSMLIHEQENDPVMQTTMGLLCMHLAYHTDRLNRGVQEKFDDMLVKESMEYINTQYQHASLTELADRLHQSRYSLSRLLKEKTGETFREMVQNKRFYRAQELLTESDLPVNDVILSVGYENTSYFHRKFKEKYNMTPRKYRELFHC